MARAYVECTPHLALEPVSRWKRVGVAWTAVYFNFSLWGAFLWSVGLVG